MTEKRFTHKKWYDERQLFDGEEAFAIVDTGTQASIICNRLNKLSDENEKFKKALIELKEIGDYQYSRIKELSDENEQLKKGMIEVVDRSIRNVEHNPPSSVRTYLKVKGALVNVREGLRDLLEDLK